MDVLVSFPGIGLEITVNRVALSIGGFDIYWYGILIGLGLLLGMVYATLNAKKFGIDSDRLLDVILVGAIAGIIGARVYYFVFAAPGEFDSIVEIFNFRKGGLAFYGTVIFAVVSTIFMCPLRKVKFLPALDVASGGFLIGQAIGRWGNFINQEAFGINTTLPWGMKSDVTTFYLQNSMADLVEKGIMVDPMLPVHPTFLYESLWCAIGFLFVLFYANRRKFDGEIFLIYLAWNGFGRFFIEGLRTDSLYIGSIRVSQLLALAGFVVSLMAIIVIRKKIQTKRKTDVDYMMPFGKTDEAKLLLLKFEQERENKKLEKTNKKIKEAEKEIEQKEKQREQQQKQLEKENQEKIEKAAKEYVETLDKASDDLEKVAKDVGIDIDKKEIEKDK